MFEACYINNSSYKLYSATITYGASNILPLIPFISAYRSDLVKRMCYLLY